MTIQPIANGEGGLSVRAKLNALIEESNELGLRDDPNLALLADRTRPGDGLAVFTSALDGGDPIERDVLNAALQDTGDDGSVARLGSSGIVARRAMEAIEPARTYRIRYVVRRRVNASDPSNDTVRCGVAWYGQTKTALTAPNDVTVIQDLTTLTSASGRTQVAGLVSRTAGTGITVPPTGARYARLYVEVFGGLQTTDVEVLDWDDITDADVWSPDVSAFDARLDALESEDLPTRVEDLETSVGTPHSKVFQTRTAAAAATIPVGIVTVETLGLTSVNDGAHAYYKRVVSATAGGFQSADGQQWAPVHEGSLHINAKIYGAKGDGSTDDTAAIQAAVTAALAVGRSVYFPAGLYLLSAKVTAAGFVRLVGAGEAHSRIAWVAGAGNTPMFEYTVNATVEDVGCEGLTFISQIATGAPYGETCAINVIGNDTGWLQYSNFQRCSFISLHAGLKFARDPHTTSFGEEGGVAWCTFDSLTFRGGNNPVKWGIHHTLGSGTGNTYSNMRGGFDDYGALVRAEGTGCVVGDILIDASTCGASGTGAGTALLSIGPDTVYRQRINISGNQSDAGMTGVIAMDGAGATPYYSNLQIDGNNLGGSVSLADAMLPVRSSRITDMEVSEWRVGKLVPNSVEVAGTVNIASGAITIPCFEVLVGSGWATIVEFKFAGSVAGLATCSGRYIVHLRDNGGTLNSQLDSSFLNPPSTPNIFNLSLAIAGMQATFGVTFTAPSAGTLLDAQLKVECGRVRVRRIP